MRFVAIGSLVASAALFVTTAAGQNAPPPQSAARTSIATTKLPSVVDTPMHFRAVTITIPPAASSSVSATNGILYQLSGSTEVSVGAEMKKLASGEGLFIAKGNMAMLKAGSGEPSTVLWFLLASAADLDKVVAAPPAVVQSLYRTSAPLPNLKPGPYDLSLTRITFPAQMPANAPHHRSGAALYYIVSGTGANTIEGKEEAKPAGSFIYEPYGLVHQWGNTSTAPFTFLAFNINPEGVPAVVAGAPK